jgi:hypothetical protein
MGVATIGTSRIGEAIHGGIRCEHCMRGLLPLPLLIVHVLQAKAGSSTMSQPQAQQQSIIGDHAFAFFTGSPQHPAAPALLEIISMMQGGDDNEEQSVRLDSLPGAHAPSLSDEGKLWVGDALLSCGFTKRADGVLTASPELLDSLRKEQNEARKRAHAVAAEQRETLLSEKLQGLRKATPPQYNLGQARAALKHFLSTFDGQPAVGPLLLGVASLLRAQAASGTEGRRWLVERATVLNGGDAFVRDAVPLMGHMGVIPGGAVDPELGQSAGADELGFEVAPGAWTAMEMGALAALLERRCARQTFGGRASGRVEESARAYEARLLASWPDWLGSVLAAWMCRLAP